MMETGSLSILNVGAGDISIVFNEHDEAEAEKAIAMLTDMQKRGYAILVQLEDGSYARATSIDATRGRYVISVGLGEALPAGAEEVSASAVDDSPPLKGRRGRPRKVSLPIRKTRAVGVARSAGG